MAYGKEREEKKERHREEGIRKVDEYDNILPYSNKEERARKTRKGGLNVGA